MGRGSLSPAFLMASSWAGIPDHPPPPRGRTDQYGLNSLRKVGTGAHSRRWADKVKWGVGWGWGMVCTAVVPSAHMGPPWARMAQGFQSRTSPWGPGGWQLPAPTSLRSADPEKWADELHMPSLPEKMFGDNVLRIHHFSGFGIEVNATDALRRVANHPGTLKGACAAEGRKAAQRAHTPRGC